VLLARAAAEVEKGRQIIQQCRYKGKFSRGWKEYAG
jgi:hypothetical protein